ncbi:hypothetical protein [Massilia sp. Se16.2.3]|uniref:hypothetical protein n=1 Tax=Massilia sp. Se16.2.3 TaxID=2709303 RepID=UPI00160026AF|nr:hypothetical protein [Massilia sp. Se16.2.3]QNA97549.1 hypothetical protein G4G31_01580 [Massilia sp. Se16.2.3]
MIATTIMSSMSVNPVAWFSLDFIAGTLKNETFVDERMRAFWTCPAQHAGHTLAIHQQLALCRNGIR